MTRPLLLEFSGAPHHVTSVVIPESYLLRIVPFRPNPIALQWGYNQILSIRWLHNERYWRLF